MKKDARTGMTPRSFLILISTVKKTTEMTKKKTVRRRWKMSQWSRNHLEPDSHFTIKLLLTLHLFHLLTPTMRRKLTRTPRHIPMTTPDTSNLQWSLECKVKPMFPWVVSYMYSSWVRR